MDGRRLVAMGIVALSVGLVGAEFLRAAGGRAEAMRGDACRALTPDPVPPSLVGQEAPDFELKDGNGKTWSLKSLRGRPVLLNFWATWCPPCVEEMPAMEALAQRVGDRAVVLAVSVDESWDEVKKFFARGTPLSVLLDESKEVPKKYGTEKYPETFLIDSAGKVRHYFVNKRHWGMAEAALCLDTLR
jgi:peroxiredoxin